MIDQQPLSWKDIGLTVQPGDLCSPLHRDICLCCKWVVVSTLPSLNSPLFLVLSQLHDFWRLDYWEDDLRRRRRFVRNAFGSTHADVSLKALEEYGAWCKWLQMRYIFPCQMFGHIMTSIQTKTHRDRRRRRRRGSQVQEDFPQPVCGRPEPWGGADAGGRRWRRQSAARKRDRQPCR